MNNKLLEGKKVNLDKRTMLQLDFHSGAKVKNIGGDFEPDRYGKTISKAGYGSVMLFAKCHYGYCYYPTKTGAMHPNLDFDLFGAQVKALKKYGVESFAYFTVVRENRLGRMHPDWLQKVPGHTVDMNRDQWLNVCISSPMVEEHLIPQVIEVAKKYPVMCIYFDIVVYPHEGCLCKFCVKEMKERGIDPNDRIKRIEFGLEKRREFLKRMYEVIKNVNPELIVSHNNCIRFGMRELIPYIDLVDVECVPSAEGYWFYPTMSRYLRTLNVDYKGVSCRFHKTWGDFGSLKTVDQLRFEGATQLAGGGIVGIGGDQPQGGCRLQKQVYKNSGKINRQINKIVPYMRNAKSVAEIAILPDSQNSPGVNHPGSEVFGAVKMLMELHLQFDVIDEFEKHLSGYKLIILPNNRKIDKNLHAKLAGYLKKGGKVLATGDAVLPQNGTEGLLAYFGISEYKGMSPDSIGYLRAEDIVNFVDKDLEICIYDKFRLMSAIQDAKVWFRHVSSLYEQYPGSNKVHRHSPPGEETGSPAILSYKNCAYAASAIFSSYFVDGYIIFRKIISRMIQELLPDSVLETSIPANVEIQLYRNGNDAIVHLVNFCAARGGKHYEVIDTIPAIVGGSLKIHTDCAPIAVESLIREKNVPFLFSNGILEIRQDILESWEVLLIKGCF